MSTWTWGKRHTRAKKERIQYLRGRGRERETWRRPLTPQTPLLAGTQKGCVSDVCLFKPNEASSFFFFLLQFLPLCFSACLGGVYFSFFPLLLYYSALFCTHLETHTHAHTYVFFTKCRRVCMCYLCYWSSSLPASCVFFLFVCLLRMVTRRRRCWQKRATHAHVHTSSLCLLSLLSLSLSSSFGLVRGGGLFIYMCVYSI